MLLHLHIEFDVMVCGGWGLMSEHEGDNRDVDAGLKQMHRRCVAAMPISGLCRPEWLHTEFVRRFVDGARHSLEALVGRMCSVTLVLIAVRKHARGKARRDSSNPNT
jgi:hypothetical protein